MLQMSYKKKEEPGVSWLVIPALVVSGIGVAFVLIASFLWGLLEWLWDIHPILVIGLVLILFLLGVHWATSFGP